MRGGRLTEEGLRFLINACRGVKPNVESVRTYLQNYHKDRANTFSKSDIKIYLGYMRSSISTKHEMFAVIKRKDREAAERERLGLDVKIPPGDEDGRHPGRRRSRRRRGRHYPGPPPSPLSSSSSSSHGDDGPGPGRGSMFHSDSARRRTRGDDDSDDGMSALRELARAVEEQRAALAAENARAVSVVISGATGPLSNFVNGLFYPSREVGADGRRIYKKRGDHSVCLEHVEGYWSVKPMSVKGTPNYYANVQGNSALLDCSSRRWMLGDGKGSSIPNPAIRLVSQEQYTRETAALQRRHDAEIAAAAADAQRRRAAEAAAALEAQRRGDASGRLGAALKRGVQNKRDAEAEAQRRQIEAAAEAQRQRDDEAEAARQGQLAEAAAAALEAQRRLDAEAGSLKRKQNMAQRERLAAEAQRQRDAAAASQVPSGEELLKQKFVSDLKDSLQNGTPLKREGNDNIVMNDVSYSPDSPTIYVSYDGRGEPYTIRAVLGCARTFDLGYMDYLTYAKSNGLNDGNRVLLVDRHKLLENLLGPSPSKENVERCLKDVTIGPDVQVPGAAAEEPPKQSRSRWNTNPKLHPLTLKKRRRRRQDALESDMSSTGSFDTVFSSSGHNSLGSSDSLLSGLSSTGSLDPVFSSSGHKSLGSSGALSSGLLSTGSQGSKNRDRLNELADNANDMVIFESQDEGAGSPMSLDSGDGASLAASVGLANPHLLGSLGQVVHARDADDGQGLGPSSNPVSPVANSLSPMSDLVEGMSRLSMRPQHDTVNPPQVVNEVYNVTIQYTPEHPRKPVQKKAVLTITNQGVTITIGGVDSTLSVDELKTLTFNIAKSMDMGDSCFDTDEKNQDQVKQRETVGTSLKHLFSKCVRVEVRKSSGKHPFSLKDITTPFTIKFDNIKDCDEFLQNLNIIKTINAARRQGGGKKRNNTKKQSHKKTHKYIQRRRKYKTKKIKKSKMSRKSKRY